MQIIITTWIKKKNCFAKIILLENKKISKGCQVLSANTLLNIHTVAALFYDLLQKHILTHTTRACMKNTAHVEMHFEIYLPLPFSSAYNCILKTFAEDDYNYSTFYTRNI